MWSILDRPVYGNQILIYLNTSIFYLRSQCSRSKFNFLFQLSSYATKKVSLNVFLAINMASQDCYCKFHFLGGFHSQMPKTPKMFMKKHLYWWINHENLKVILFFLWYVKMCLRSSQVSVMKVLVKQLTTVSLVIMIVTRTMGHSLKQSCVK